MWTFRVIVASTNGGLASNEPKVNKWKGYDDVNDQGSLCSFQLSFNYNVPCLEKIKETAMTSKIFVSIVIKTAIIWKIRV